MEGPEGGREQGNRASTAVFQALLDLAVPDPGPAEISIGQALQVAHLQRDSVGPGKSNRTEDPSKK